MLNRKGTGDGVRGDSGGPLLFLQRGSVLADVCKYLYMSVLSIWGAPHARHWLETQGHLSSLDFNNFANKSAGAKHYRSQTSGAGIYICRDLRLKHYKEVRINQDSFEEKLLFNSRNRSPGVWVWFRVKCFTSQVAKWREIATKLLPTDRITITVSRSKVRGQKVSSGMQNYTKRVCLTWTNHDT